MARPIKEVDTDVIEKMAEINNTVDDIAYVVGLHKRTIMRRYAHIVQKGRANGRYSLKKRMWDIAMSDSAKGSVTMCIFLSKQMLGYRDRFPDEGDMYGKPMIIENMDGKTTVTLGTTTNSDDGPS